MAAIATGDVTYTAKIKDRSFLGPGHGYIQRATLVFGDGSVTYTSGGVPLLKGKLGMKWALNDLIFNEASAGDGLIYKYDKSAEKIRIYYPTDQTATAGDRAGAELATPALATTTLEVEAIGF